MQTEETANPTQVKQTSFVVVPTQPTQTKQSVILRAPEDIPAEIQKRAAEDWQAHKLDGADLVSLLNIFNSQHESAQDRYDYGYAIARLRYPAPTRRETSRNWRRNAPRKVAA